MALAIAALAFFKGDVEKNRFDFAIVKIGELDVSAAFVGREIGRVDVGYGAAQLDTVLEEFTKHAEDAAVNILVFGIVGEKTAKFVAGERGRAAFFYIGRFTGSGETD